MRKRGQIQQIFVWILVLIVAVAILFFGFKLIKQSGELKDEVLVVRFFNELDKKVSQYYYLDKGSSGREKFSLPNDVRYVCFADKENFNFRSFGAIVKEADKNLIQALIPDSGELYYNVFVGPMSLYEKNMFKLKTLFDVEPNPKCLRVVGGVLTLDLENAGVDEGVQIK